MVSPHPIRDHQPPVHRPTNGGLDVLIRPIESDDEPALRAFHQTLSLETVYSRYFNVFDASQRTTHERLYGVCHPQPLREWVLVAEVAVAGGGRAIAGVGRLSKRNRGDDAEVALLVDDAYQRRGIGLALMRRLVATAKERHFTQLRAEILLYNTAMQRMARKVGMRLSDRVDDGIVKATMAL